MSAAPSVNRLAAPEPAPKPLERVCRNCLHFTREWTDVDDGVCQLAKHAGQASLIPRDGGQRKRGCDTCPSFTPYTWRGYE